MDTTEYDVDLRGKSDLEVLKFIEKYHEDEGALCDAGFDVINSIRDWLDAKFDRSPPSEAGATRASKKALPRMGKH
jgi:hypothetical protein